MAKINITNLTTKTIIGIYDWERKKKQRIYLDLELTTNITKAASTDDLNNALDYEHLAKLVTQFISNSKFKLIETLAKKTAELIYNEFNVDLITLKLTKPKAIKNAESVSITYQHPSTD